MQLISRLWLKMLKEWWQLTAPMCLRAQGVELGAGVRFYGYPIVVMVKDSRIRIGDGVVLCSDSRFTALGVNHPVVLRTLRPDAEIIIGNNCGISGGSICAAIRVEVGNECLLGANVTISDSDFHAVKPDGRRLNSNPHDIGAASVTIEDNVFIGTGVVILKGVCVGTNSVIGAMSVVSKNIQRNSIYAGVPAVLIKQNIHASCSKPPLP